MYYIVSEIYSVVLAIYLNYLYPAVLSWCDVRYSVTISIPIPGVINIPIIPLEPALLLGIAFLMDAWYRIKSYYSFDVHLGAVAVRANNITRYHSAIIDLSDPSGTKLKMLYLDDPDVWGLYYAR